MPDRRLVDIISKVGASWVISKQEVGRELLVIPAGKKAFETIALAIEKEYIRREDAPKYCHLEFPNKFQYNKGHGLPIIKFKEGA